MKPLVSVIVPTYNRSQLLGRALHSVLAQTYPDWECLVIDDASVDETEEVVKRLGDSRIRYLRHDTNRGASATRNTGIAEARGEHLAFLDSDDEWLPEKLEKQLAVLETTKDPLLGVVVCGRIVTKPTGEQIVPGPDLQGGAYRKVLTLGFGGFGSSCFVRRSVFDVGIRFDESFVACEDRDFMAQILCRFRVESLTEPLIRQHRNHGDDHLWQGENAARGLERLIVKYSNDLKRWPHDLARLHHSVGIRYLFEGYRRAARRHFVAACRYEPLRISVYVWFSVSLASPSIVGWIERRRASGSNSSGHDRAKA